MVFSPRPLSTHSSLFQRPYYLKGDTPLHDAAKFGHTEVAKVLVGRGADISLKNKHGETPLDVARAHVKPDIVELLEVLSSFFTFVIFFYVSHLSILDVIVLLLISSFIRIGANPSFEKHFYFH